MTIDCPFLEHESEKFLCIRGEVETYRSDKPDLHLSLVDVSGIDSLSGDDMDEIIEKCKYGFMNKSEGKSCEIFIDDPDRVIVGDLTFRKLAKNFNKTQIEK